MVFSYSCRNAKLIKRTFQLVHAQLLMLPFGREGLFHISHVLARQQVVRSFAFISCIGIEIYYRLCEECRLRTINLKVALLTYLQTVLHCILAVTLGTTPYMRLVLT